MKVCETFVILYSTTMNNDSGNSYFSEPVYLSNVVRVLTLSLHPPEILPNEGRA